LTAAGRALRLASVESPETRNPCPCCGHLTLRMPTGSHELCPVCFWEDDLVQLRWPDYSGGANRPALIDAQRTYADVGAKEARVTAYVRPPTPDEPIDPGWRPVDVVTDSFEPRGSGRAPWPEDRSVLYWWRPTFWRAPQD